MSEPNEKPPVAAEGKVDANTCSQVSDACAGSQPQQVSIEPRTESALSYSVWPQHLVPPAGLVGDLMEYFLSSARYPMEEGAAMGALALVAGIAGRSFNFDGTGLNLYLVVLAESGRGKEDMRAGIDRMLSAVRMQIPNVDDHIGPDTFASGQALIRALDGQPCFLSIQGEFGLRLKELSDPRAPGAVVVLRRALLDLYGKSSQHGVLRPTAYSDLGKNTKLVRAPALTILGESTPGHVYDHLSFSDIEDGMLPRCLVLECTSERPRTNLLASGAPPAALVERFARFCEMSIAMNKHNTCAGVLATPEAAAALKRFQDELDDRFNDKRRDAHDRALWNRAGLNIKRIAALIAVGCTGAAGTAVVELAYVEWAIAFVTYCVDGLAARFRNGQVGAGESRQEAELKRIAREYFQLSSKERQRYGVPQIIADEESALSVGYLRRRAARLTAFKDDRKGFNVAFKATLQALCESGWLYKFSPQEVLKNFGARMGDVYGIGKQAGARD